MTNTRLQHLLWLGHTAGNLPKLFTSITLASISAQMTDCSDTDYLALLETHIHDMPAVHWPLDFITVMACFVHPWVGR